MNWRKPSDLPKDDQLVWIITNPHKQTVVSSEISGGWVFFHPKHPNLWGIDNMDETGYGSTCWYIEGWEDSIDAHPFASSMCYGSLIAAWIPADEFIYPAWVDFK